VECDLRLKKQANSLVTVEATTEATNKTTTITKTIQNALDGLSNSFILSQIEINHLSDMVSFQNAQLLYRATRDGFTASSFHKKCDGYSNTAIIIKTDSNYVFGGFTSAKWNSSSKNYGYVPDENAFIFSLRRNGIENGEKFNPNKSSNYKNYAIVANKFYNAIFGWGYDVYICDNSNILNGSYSDFCYTYECPSVCLNNASNKCRQSYLAGSFKSWLTTEIEPSHIK
jgi:hypothetical protein